MTEDRRKTDAKETPNQRLTLIWLSYFTLIFIIVAFVYVTLNMDKDSGAIGTAITFLSMLAVGVLGVISGAGGFNFGSSTGSSARDAMAAKVVDTASTVAETAKTVANTAAGTGTGATPTP